MPTEVLSTLSSTADPSGATPQLISLHSDVTATTDYYASCPHGVTNVRVTDQQFWQETAEFGQAPAQSDKRHGLATLARHHQLKGCQCLQTCADKLTDDLAPRENRLIRALPQRRPDVPPDYAP